MAALETKIEGYEKEIKQLQKALEKSDRYIAELEKSETPQNTFNFNSRQHQTDNQQNANFATDSFVHSKVEFKTNENKNVKFSDKTDTVPLINKPIVKSSISKDNFYGSPSKNSPCKSKQNGSVKCISSFSDRLKASNDSALLLDDTNFKQYSKLTHGSSNNILLTNCDKPAISVSSQNSQSFLFSPMKRLRLDEVVLEKPDETSIALGNNTLASSTDTDTNMITPPRNTTLPFNSNSQLLNNDQPIQVNN